MSIATPLAAPRMVVAGEALIDFLQQPGGQWRAVLGGSPFNLARALGRLGVAVDYASPLSGDAFGQQLRAALQDSGVRCLGAASALPTSLALVELDAQGQPHYAFYRQGVADRDLEPMALLENWPPQARVFHVGSLALMPPDGPRWLPLIQALRQRGVTISVDINMRPAIGCEPAAYVAFAHTLLAQSDVVKVSDEDLRALGHEGQPLHQAQRLLRGATQMVVLTLGHQGAWALTPGTQHFAPSAQVPVVDTVGAGDCFYAGFLARLAQRGLLGQPACDWPGEALADALAWGAQAAGLNLQRAGCQPPWLAELAASHQAFNCPQGAAPAGQSAGLFAAAGGEPR